MEPEIKVNFSPEGDIGTLLIGKANTPPLPQKLVIQGNFQSVSEFASKRMAVGEDVRSAQQEITPGWSVVICNNEQMTIKLLTDPNDEFATEVTGKAEYTDVFNEFGINQNKMFNREQLVKLIRFNRRYFPNKEEHANLLAKYQAFKAHVHKDLTDESDRRGNRNFGINKTVSSDLPETFVLKIPIFKGENDVSFPVEIALEENDSGVRFWFESVELSELLADMKDVMFDRELKELRLFNVPIIIQ